MENLVDNKFTESKLMAKNSTLVISFKNQMTLLKEGNDIFVLTDLKEMGTTIKFQKNDVKQITLAVCITQC